MDLVKIETIDRGEVTARRVQEIKKALAQAEEELERSLQAAVKTADYYRSLALAYMAQEMFPLALEALKSALEFYPTSPSLHYFAGVCSAQMARGRIDPAERARLWTEAEYYYRLALTFKPQYGEAAYALGVLYHFELGRSADAETQLAALLGYQDDNPAALFLMAQVKVSLGKPEEALGCYDRILAVSQDETVRQNALANRDRLLRGQNG
jgi:tetratricopeptide (TPR) repeat protein